jgi:cytochrome c6
MFASTSRRFVAVALTVGLALTAVACGSDDSDTTSTPAATAPATTATSAVTERRVSAALGKTIFARNCATCHTLAASGATGSAGPNLDDLKPSRETVANQVTNGGGGMPSFKETLLKAQIDSVALYVSSVAGKS